MRQGEQAGAGSRKSTSTTIVIDAPVTRTEVREARGGAGASRAATGVLSGPQSQPQPTTTPTIDGTGSARSLGIGEALRREPTLTGKMRAVQPPDVARQAMSELVLLARELAALPTALDRVGLARTHQHTYFEAVREYEELARSAWVAIAEERLEQSGASPEYRQRAITIARRITALQREHQLANENTVFALPRRRPMLWRRRTRLITSGLRSWQTCLAQPPDVRRLGEGLFLLRGALSLASAGGVALALLGIVAWVARVALGLVSVGVLLALVSALLLDTPGNANGLALAALGLVPVDVLAWLALAGPSGLGRLLALICYSPTRSPRAARRGSRVGAAMLWGWWVLMGAAGLGAIPLGLILGGSVVVASLPADAPTDLAGTLGVVGTALTGGLAPLALLEVVTLLLLGAPTLVATLVSLTAELAGNRSWIPTARRAAIRPTLPLVGAVTVVVLVGLALGVPLAVSSLPLLLVLPIGASFFAITPLTLALALGVIVPYIACIEAPYRMGISRWRRAWLRELSTRRADLESHVRRLSAVDPATGVQDTSDETLRAMQYDLVLLQFYRTKTEEAERMSAAPLTIGATLVVLALALLAGLLLDGNALHLAPLLLTFAG